MSDDLPLVEPVAVPDTYVSGLSHIEELSGGNMRFTFFAIQEMMPGSDAAKVVKVRIVMHADNVLEAARAAMMAASGMAGVMGHTLIDRRH